MNTCIVDLLWGDAGKGKLNHVFCETGEYYYAVRYNGGPNAGHSVCTEDGGTFKLHQVPVGAVSEKEPFLVLAHGMVLNPVTLWEEIHTLMRANIDIRERTMISKDAHVIMPWHIAADIKKGGKIGTTKKGIGPTYADKAHRWNAIRMGDLVEKLKGEKLQRFFAVDEAFHGEGLWHQYCDAAKMLQSMVGDTGKLLRQAVSEKKNILFESANGIHLDIDFGTYPYCTSSGVGPAAIPQACGLPNLHLNHIIGVTKVYTTRVGEGPLPSEICPDTDPIGCRAPVGCRAPAPVTKEMLASEKKDRNGEAFSPICDCDWCTSHRIREQGGEYGTTTGRPRRIGWLDIDKLIEGIHYTGATELALMHVDALCGFKEVGVYIDGNIEMFAGWKLISDDPNLDKFIRMIEVRTGLPVSMVSCGPKQNEIYTRPQSSCSSLGFGL